MSLPSFRTFAACALALVGVCVVAGRSAAEQGWPLNPENRGSAFSSPRYYRTVAPTYARVASPTLPASSLASTPIHLQVPAQAQVWFDNVPTTQTGPAREFLAPPLTPGHQYNYTVRATWREGGREVQRQQLITFTAGDPVSIDFTTSMVSVTP
jgi:uncharacterized protein (TIGR03000 family)